MQPATHLKQKSETWGLDDELCVNKKRIFFFFIPLWKNFQIFYNYALYTGFVPSLRNDREKVIDLQVWDLYMEENDSWTLQRLIKAK